MRTLNRRLVGAVILLLLSTSPALAAPQPGEGSWWSQLVEWLGSWRPTLASEARPVVPRLFDHAPQGRPVVEKAGGAYDPAGTPTPPTSSSGGTGG